MFSFFGNKSNKNKRKDKKSSLIKKIEQQNLISENLNYKLDDNREYLDLITEYKNRLVENQRLNDTLKKLETEIKGLEEEVATLLFPIEKENKKMKIDFNFDEEDDEEIPIEESEEDE